MLGKAWAWLERVGLAWQAHEPFAATAPSSVTPDDRLRPPTRAMHGREAARRVSGAAEQRSWSGAMGKRGGATRW